MVNLGMSVALALYASIRGICRCGVMHIYLVVNSLRGETERINKYNLNSSLSAGNSRFKETGTHKEKQICIKQLQKSASKVIYNLPSQRFPPLKSQES